MNKQGVTLFTFCAILFFSTCQQREEKRELLPADGGKFYGGVLNVNESEYLKTLYPPAITDVFSYRIASQIYEGLFTFDPRTLRTIPLLVENYSVSEDGKTYIFRIKDNVFFHDDECFENGKGRELTSEDVIYCFERLGIPADNNMGHAVLENIEGFSSFYAGQSDEIEGIEAIDDHTLKISLTNPGAFFTTQLARSFTYIYPREAVEYYGEDFRRSPVGTGPFYLHDLNEGSQVVLRKNQNYHGKDENGNQLPFLEAINITFINDKKSELFEFRKGNLDMIYRLPTEYIIEILEETMGNESGDYSNFQLQRKPEMVTHFLVFNNDSLFRNKNLRKAFSYAIDREKILNFVLNGEGYAAGTHGITPPVFPDYNLDLIKGYPFDVDSALFYMDKAGYPGGTELGDITIYLNAEGQRNTNVAVEIQKQLKEHINVEVKLNVIPFAQLTDRSMTGDFTLMRMAWYADYPNPESFLSLFSNRHMENGQNVYPNIARYNSDRFQESYEAGLSAETIDEAYSRFIEAENIMIEDAPVLILWYDEGYRLLQPWVKDFFNNSIEFRNYATVYFDKTDPSL